MRRWRRSRRRNRRSVLKVGGRKQIKATDSLRRKHSVVLLKKTSFLSEASQMSSPQLQKLFFFKFI